MDVFEQNAQLQRAHPFTLPTPGEQITSAETGVTYQVGPFLGSGAFGVVYECSDQWGDRLVAKVLRPVAPPEEMLIRATDEAISAAIARSPHTLHVADAFVYKGAYYIISERCAMSLRDMIECGRLTPTIWFPKMAKAVLHALHSMHHRGLVHCDIHLGNVFLYRKDDILRPDDQGAHDFKLGDFGQTRLIEAVDARSTWNPSCIPPEILDSTEFGQLDQRADIYQAGLLFLQFLSGGGTEFDHDDVLSGRPREIAEALQHPGASAIAKMLRRHVSARPTTGLEAWLEFDEGKLLLQ